MDADGDQLDVWVEFETRPWPDYREVIVNLRAYLHSLVLGGESDVAARAARMLLDHPPLAESSKLALAIRFPQQGNS